MKKLTKITSAIVAAALAVTSTATPFPVQFLNTQIYAYASEFDNYFYEQLTDEAKPFYDGMENMYRQGIMKTGNGDYDLVSNGHITSEKVAEYGGGGPYLLSLFGAAKDAFYADHADIFYVDFSYLSVRVTKDINDIYHVYIGSGRSDNYYTEGFTNEGQVDSAISYYEAIVNDLAAQADSVTAEEGESLDAEKVKFVHDYIIDHTSYRLENVCRPENIGLIRTAYGALVNGESVCEGYSRALKAVLDRLGIPCVLVYGIYMHNENTPELHMWCEVRIDGIWYAVDATMDDPYVKNSTSTLDGFENQDYLLVGQSTMSRQHFPSGIMSEAEYEFSYPPLSIDGFNVETISNYNGLTVKFKSDGELEDEEAGVFYVSYNGMGVAKAAEQGKYLIAKMDIYYENTDEWIMGEWGYLLPDVYSAIEDFDTEVRLPLPHVQYVQFAITDIAPGDYKSDPNRTRYLGDPMMFEAYTGTIYNPSGNYLKPPYVQSITPAMNGRITIGKSYHVVAVYDDPLQLETEDSVPDIVMYAESALPNTQTTAMEYARYGNFTWDGDRTIEFDFTPSDMWMDDMTLYTFSVKGLVGSRSLKAPNDICYGASFNMCPCAYRSQGYDWALFGKPTLMDNIDLDTSSWITDNGEKIADELKDRMVLVASSPTHNQTDEMIKMIEGQTGENVLSEETFNIHLTVCKAQVVKTGDKVRVQLGFPAGYGPDDEGVTFKAYHFFKDDAGNITGVEEIPCIITKYGLIILCDSFSPYAVVAVKDDGQETENTSKNVLVTVSEGGSVSGDKIFTLDSSESETLTVNAKEGFEIDSITVAGKNIEITNEETMEITISNEEIADLNGIVNIAFAAKSVHEKEKGREETVAQVEVSPATIELEESISVKAGDSIKLEPKITNSKSSDINSYQWYKDDLLLTGENSPSLSIKKATLDDVGVYKIEVTTSYGASSITSDKSINVIVEENGIEHSPNIGNNWQVPSTSNDNENNNDNINNEEQPANTEPSSSTDNSDIEAVVTEAETTQAENTAVQTESTENTVEIADTEIPDNNSGERNPITGSAGIIAEVTGLAVIGIGITLFIKKKRG